MSPSRATLLGLALSLLGAGCARGVAPRTRAAGPSPALPRIVTLGASLTAGFGVGSDLATALEATLRAETAVESVADLWFFQDAFGVGEKRIQEVQDLGPTLLCAMDFLFWFAYGDIVNPRNEVELRRARLKRGCELLERLSCPIVVADFPDMSSAEGRMLARSQIPGPEALAVLNASLYAWAAGRENVVVLPLSARRELLQSSEGFTTGRVTIPDGCELLLGDQLHPSFEGQAAIALWVADAIVDAGWARASEFHFDFETVTEGILARANRPVR